MTVTTAPGRRSNLIGSLFMVAAMGAFALEDALLKALSQSLPVGQLMIMFGLLGAAIFAGLIRARGAPLFTPDVLSRPMRLRAVFELVGRLFYVLAIALTPLSAATVILQATPLVVVAGAALLFGEQVGWRRWSAIVIGLTGVIVIIRPGADSFSLLSILAIIGMLGFAGRDLASRAAPAALSTSMLGLYGFLTVVVAGGFYALWEGKGLAWPAPEILLILCGAAVTGVVAYSCLMKAMRTGDVSAVTPFRYIRLLFGIGLGILLFGERLDIWMLIGSGLIVLSGLFILWRGKQTAQSGGA